MDFRNQFETAPPSSGPSVQSGDRAEDRQGDRKGVSTPLGLESLSTAAGPVDAGPLLPVDGEISILDGVVTIRPPERGGRWPIIQPGTNATILINGRALDDKHTLGPDDQVEVRPNHEAPGYEIRVQLSSDKMQAQVSIHRHAGRRFRLLDVPWGQFARVTGEQEDLIEPSDPSVEEIVDKLREAGVVYGLDANAMEDLTYTTDARSLVVASGRPPKEPVDGLVRFFFTELSEVNINPNATRIDLYDRHAITWVLPRDVLAEKIEPVPGEEGMDVLGNKIRPRSYRNPALSVGEGVELREEGHKAVATREGRPILDGKTIKVIPTFVVASNADASTGHIKFSGDVIINGDVQDRVEVVAGGLVEVLGLVSHAKISGKQGVIVQKGIIGGNVEAGGVAAECERVLSIVNSLGLRMRTLLNAVEQLQGQTRLRDLGLTDGQLVQQLLESKFSDIPKQIMELKNSDVRSLIASADFSSSLASLESKLVGLGPAGIGSRWELRALLDSLTQLSLHLEAVSVEEADIEVKDLQNATLTASGKILIGGTGCYHSKIMAGRGVKAARGLLRGGKVVVNAGNVEFKELGAPGGTATEVVIVNEGVVTADTIHPNVSISIKGQSRTFRDPIRRARAHVNDKGELVV